MGAFTYPRSEPGSAGHLDLVERLNEATATLKDGVAGLSEEVLTAYPEDGGWSIKETVGHLCDVSHILHKRLDMMIKLEEPRLAGYDPEELADGRNAQGQHIDALLAEFASQRAETVEMLSELVHWNWARPGRHPALGRISVRQQVDAWLDHEAEHLAQVRRLTDGAQAAANG